jgi:hypothetical protein
MRWPMRDARLGREATNVLRMSSMSLDRLEEGAPMSISPAGAESVTHEPCFRDAVGKCNDALDTVFERHGTIDEARDSKSPDYEAYLEAKRFLQQTTRKLVSHVREHEYQEEVSRSSGAIAVPASQPDQAPAPVGETKDGFFTNDALTQYGENGDLAHGLVNPLLLDPRAFNEKLDSLSSDETAQDDDSECTAVEEDDEAAVEYIEPQAQDFISDTTDDADSDPKLQATDESNRLHGLYRYTTRQRCATGSYYETQVFRAHRFDDLYPTITSDDGQLSSVQLAESVIPFFKTMHPLERYGIHLTPDPGTFICPICRDDLETESEFEDHVPACRSLNVQKWAQKRWEDAVDRAMAMPCTYQSSSANRCGKTFENRKKFITHIMEHTRRKVKAVCKFGGCSTPVEILDRDEWSDHLAEEHGLTCFLSADATTFFCSFCDDFIMLGLVGPSAIATHYNTHLTDALDSARRFGYGEVRSEVGGTALLSVRLPWLCIFCVHNHALPADQKSQPC